MTIGKKRLIPSAIAATAATAATTIASAVTVTEGTAFIADATGAIMYAVDKTRHCLDYP